MQNKIFEYGEYRYDYKEIRENRKTFSLAVYPNMSIILKVPQGAKSSKIESFLKRKWMWLEKQLRYFEKYQSKKYRKEYISGESFLYLGRQYKLKVIKGNFEGVKLIKGMLVLSIKNNIHNSKYNKKLLDDWYEEKTREKFQERYSIILKNFNYDYNPQLITRKMKKRWGSYLTGKKVILNPELIKAPIKAIDYVITHELCHMKIKTHNCEFYNLLESKFPEWKKIKEQLELRLG